MTYEEFLKWLSYFEKRPVGWREDLRAYYQMRAAGVTEKPTTIFASLEPIMKDGGERNPVDSLKGSYLFSKMLSAKGGERLDVLDQI